MTYDSCLLLVHLHLVLLDTFLATEKDKTIAKVLLLRHAGTLSFRISWRVLNLGPRALGLVTDESKSVDLDLLALDECGRALDDKLKDGSVPFESLLQLLTVIIKLHILANQEIVGRDCTVLTSARIVHVHVVGSRNFVVVVVSALTEGIGKLGSPTVRKHINVGFLVVTVI